MRLVAAIVIAALATIARGEPERLNVVLIVADDLGWTDLGCYGSDYYKTPNIDRLAGEGVRFTDAYSAAPNCAPTRASLLTGLSPAKTGIYTVGSGARGKAEDRLMVPAPNKTVLDPEFVTIAETLRAAGYMTGSFGKWHLGKPGEAGPREQGFDVNVGGGERGNPGAGGYLRPFNVEPVDDGQEGESLTRYLAREAAGFVDEHADGPFFLYVPFYAVHTPIQAEAAVVERWQDVPAGERHRNATYAAMIETMDDGVGVILDALERNGVAGETLVIFTSDNGGLGGYRGAGIEHSAGGMEVTSQHPLRGGKGMLYDGGVRVPMIVRLPGGASGAESDRLVTSVDVLPTVVGAAGAEHPVAVDGVSFLDTARDAEADGDSTALFWHFPGYLELGRGEWRTTPVGAIRDGKWKLVEFFETGEVELYDLATDAGERRDIAEEHPAVRDRLAARLAEWRGTNDALMPVMKP